MKNSTEITMFLEKENFSSSEINLLLLFFEKQRIDCTDSVLTSPEYISALIVLEQKGLIEKKQSSKNKPYWFCSLENFFSWVRKKSSQKIQSVEDSTQVFINSLRSSLGYTVKSDVTFFEGIEGIKDSYRHILDHAQGEVCAYFSVKEEEQPDLQMFFVNEYSPERAKRNIYSRNITPKTPKTTFFKFQSEHLNMEVKMVPKEMFPLLNAEINIYGEYLHCMSFDKSGGFAVIIKGQIAALHKALFEIAWRTCSQLNILEESTTKQVDFTGEYLYSTNNVPFILDRIERRQDKFFPGMKKQWTDEKPEIEITEDGESILRIFGLEVMSDFQKPYMKELAKNVTLHGGDILNIGFGLGIVDSYIEEKRSTRDIGEHHIVELNEGVVEMAKKWREEQPHKDKIFIHQGNWEDVLPELSKQGFVFDGVVYDGYPLEIDDICRDAIPFLHAIVTLKLIKENTGILTFYLDSVDGISEGFQSYLQNLGVNNIQTNKVSIQSPNRQTEHWDYDYFIAPLLTDIRYKK